MLLGLFFDFTLIGLLIGFIMLIVGLLTSNQKFLPIVGVQPQQQVIYMPSPQQAPAMNPAPLVEGKFCPY